MAFAELYLASLLAVGTVHMTEYAWGWWQNQHPAPAHHASNPFGVPGTESDDGNYAHL